MDLRDLSTPAAIVDIDVLERNCADMATRAHRFGVQLRPHIKTHKCVEVGRLQVATHFGGVTVSTVAEARGFIRGGFRDLTYAFPLAPFRVDEIADLATQVDRLAVLVDQSETVDALVASDRPFDVFMKVDCGYGRAGVDPHSENALRLATRLAEATQLTFRGLLTHAGHSYYACNRSEIAVIAAHERSTVVTFAERLRAAGIDVPEVSVGSTPTCRVAEGLSGVTEMRPGNYAFFDLYQAAIGTCTLEDIAQSVLATVVAAYPERRQWIVDSGALAMSKDTGPTHVDGHWGFGVVRRVDGAALQSGPEAVDVRCASLSQEHGLVQIQGEFDPTLLSVGQRVRILPNHSCLAAAQFETLHVVRGVDVIDEWRPQRGW